MKRSLLVLALLATLASVAATFVSSGDEKSISEAINKLRSLPDDVRAQQTRDLAMQIRALQPGANKVLLASLLTNLSTEGDFGQDTLQEVTTTLASALKESPAPRQNGAPAYAYTQLANLARFEHMNVALESADYKAAMDAVVKLEQARAKIDFTLTDINGKEWTLSKLKGKVVLVNFWATWCPPCRKEMPDIQALYEQFKDKGLVVLAVSDETIDKVRPFIEQGKFTYPVMLDPGRKVNTMYQIDGIPKNFVYDRNGKLVAQSIDMRTRGQFLRMLAAAGLK